MKGILVTRPEPGLSETFTTLRARGFEPVAASLFSIEPRGPARLALAGLQAVLVTSAHALGALEPARVTLLLAVGDATAARARAMGFAAVLSAGGNAEALLALCRGRLSPDRGGLLLACGEGQGLRLAAALRASGFRVMRRVVYAQRPASLLPEPAREAIESGRLRAATFMSASASLAFARLVPAGLRAALGTVDALAISQGAAEPVSALPWRSVRVALRPNAEDVLALL